MTKKILNAPPRIVAIAQATQVVESLNRDAVETLDEWRYRVEVAPSGKTAKIAVIDESGQQIGYL